MAIFFQNEEGVSWRRCLEIEWSKWQINGTRLSFAQCQYCEHLLPRTKSEILQIKISFFFIIAFTCTYGWDFCWGFFLLSLNLSILSPDIILQYCTFFLPGRLLSRRKVKMLQVKKKTNPTVCFKCCGNIKMG